MHGDGALLFLGEDLPKQELLRQQAPEAFLILSAVSGAVQLLMLWVQTKRKQRNCSLKEKVVPGLFQQRVEALKHQINASNTDITVKAPYSLYLLSECVGLLRTCDPSLHFSPWHFRCPVAEL